MEAAHVIGPGLWLRIVPLPAPIGHRQSPVKQITNVRQNFPSRAATVAAIKRGECIGSPAERLGAAIRERRNRVPQELTSGIGGGKRNLIGGAHKLGMLSGSIG